MAMFFDTKYENRPYTGIERQPDLGTAPQFRYSPDDFSGGIFGALKGLTEGMAERGKEDREAKRKKEEFEAKQKAEAEQKDKDREAKKIEDAAKLDREKELIDYRESKRRFAPSRGGGGKRGGGSDGGGVSADGMGDLGDNTDYDDQKITVATADEIDPKFYPSGRNPNTGDVVKTKKTKIPPVMSPQEIAPESEEEKMKKRKAEADRLIKMGDHAGAYFKVHEGNPTKKLAALAYEKLKAGGIEALSEREAEELAAVYITMDDTTKNTGASKSKRDNAAAVKNSLAPVMFKAEQIKKSKTRDPLDEEKKRLDIEKGRKDLAYADRVEAEERDEKIAKMEAKKADLESLIKSEEAKSKNWIGPGPNNDVIEKSKNSIAKLEEKISAARSGSSAPSKKKITKSQHDSLRAEAEARGQEYLKQFDDKVKANFEVVAD